MNNKNGILLNDSYLLTQVVDEYLIQRMVSNKKYYAGYLVMAKLVWRNIFKNTIWSTQSEWMELKQCTNDNFGTPHHPDYRYYIDMPKGVNRLFSVCEQDHCGNAVPLFYNSEMNVVKKPSKKKCGCTDSSCDCGGGLCEDVNSLSKTTKLLFTINNVPYYEVTYLKVCPNGDIIEYREVPTKSYNTFAGDAGDYNTDYNNDYLIGNPPFTDFTIVTQTFQKILCKLEVNDCGCPKSTPENQHLFNEACCGFLNCCSDRKRRHCETAIGDINDNGRGHVKVSDCGTKIYYKPSRHRRNHCEDNDNQKLPEYLLVNFQTVGTSCNESVLVPEYAVDCMFLGIDYYQKRLNNSFTPVEKREAKYAFTEAQNNLISFLNPLNLTELGNVQDVPILF